MQDISKSFGANPVLHRVSFSLAKGEIRGLVGENGAGKSTLMNILGGLFPPETGSIRMDGEAMRFSSPKDSLLSGIAFIHQELNLANDLAVYENLFLGRELKTRAGLTDVKRMCEEARQVFDTMGIALDPMAMLWTLDASFKQIVEIARALHMRARIIIMDEPTTSLSQVEIDLIFDMMRRLRQQGVAFIFISHKLQEVKTICDSYSVLRDGHLVAEGMVRDTTPAQMARHMVGHDVRDERLAPAHAGGKELLRAEAIASPGRFKPLSFRIEEGEILGFTGLLGDGRSEIFQALIGLLPLSQGQLFLHGKPIRPRSPKQARALGIGYLPSNRKENGILKDLTVLENGTIVTLRDYVRHGMIARSRQQEAFQGMRQELGIRMQASDAPITSLSGGNQQKVVLAKWLLASPRLIIFDNPTQGVDVGAKEDIYDIILSLAESGVGIIILSSEAQEIVRLCQRAYVLYHGSIEGELAGNRLKEEEIMLLATGGHLEKGRNHAG